MVQMLTKTLRRAVVAATLVVVGPVWALVPLEGLVLGQVSRDLQPDPMENAFSTAIDQPGYDREAHKLYRRYYQDAWELQQSCSYIGKATYANPQSQTIARRTMVASLQYIGLDATVKAIGQYARTLQMQADEYALLVENLMKGSCSPNLSVYGLRLIKQNLLAAFETDSGLLPTFPGYPYGSTELFTKSRALETREAEFHHTVKNFRALCSWGGDVDNYRLLPPLLANPQVMSTVMRHMEGLSFKYDDAKRSVEKVKAFGSTPISCEGPLCRPGSPELFERRFPRMVGSSGLKQDLQRLWCEHFRFQNYVVGDQQSPQVREWIKEQDIEDERKDVAALVSLFTRTTDIVLTTKKYQDLAAELKRPIEARWDVWAANSLKRSSKDLYFEEGLEISVLRKTAQRRAIDNDIFALDLTVTMGELDRILKVNDKLELDLNLKVSRNWLRWVRTRALQAQRSEEPQADEEVLTEAVAAHLRVLLEKTYAVLPYFQQSSGVEALMAEELIAQLIGYEGDYFRDIQDQMVGLPVRLHYGLFALSYVRYKALLKPAPKAAPEMEPASIEPVETAPALTYRN